MCLLACFYALYPCFLARFRPLPCFVPHVDLCLLVFNDDSDEVTCGWLELLICGDRGSGMDMLQSSNPRMKTLQENSIISFNAAFKVSHESLFWSSKSPVVEMSKSSLQRSVSPF